MSKKKKKRAVGIQNPVQPTPDIGQLGRRIRTLNRLDLHVFSLLKSPSDSLEPLGPLAGKSRRVGLNQICDDSE